MHLWGTNSFSKSPLSVNTHMNFILQFCGKIVSQYAYVFLTLYPMAIRQSMLMSRWHTHGKTVPEQIQMTLFQTHRFQCEWKSSTGWRWGAVGDGQQQSRQENRWEFYVFLSCNKDLSFVGQSEPIMNTWMLRKTCCFLAFLFLGLTKAQDTWRLSLMVLFILLTALYFFPGVVPLVLSLLGFP